MATNDKVTFNRLITDKAEGLMEDTNDFVAMKAFGVATVNKRMGEYPIFKIEDLYRNSLRKRAVGSQYAETGTDIEMRSFVCADYGVEEPIAFETMEEMGEGYKQDIADKLMIDAYRNYEQVVCGFAFDEANWANVFKGADATDFDKKEFAKFTEGTNNISQLFRDLKSLVKVQCGRKPNTALMTSDVADALLENPFIRDLIATTRDQLIDEAFLAKVLDLDNIYVTDAIVNDANLDGKDMKYLNSNACLLYWDGQAGRNSLTAPCAMKVVRLNYGDTNSASGVGIYEREDEARDVQILRVKQRFAPVIQYKEAAILLKDCI
jgi:hypothetical protein